MSVNERQSAIGPLPNDVAFHVEMLPAGEGDCLLVTMPDEGSDFLILVDTGNGRDALAAVKARLLQLPLDESRQQRHLNLFIVTHIDEDHLEHAVALLKDEELGLSFDDIWFNGYDETRDEPPQFVVAGMEGVNQADVLSTLLHEQERHLPHNLAFGHRAVQVPEVAGEPPTQLKTSEPSHASGSYEPLDLGPDAPRITLLSPLPQDLRELGREWNSTQHPRSADGRSADVTELWSQVKTAGKPSSPVPDSQKALKTLAGSPFIPDETRANICSIVVLLENKGRRLLLTGDGHPHVYEPALRKLREDRAASVRQPRDGTTEGPFVIDAVKVAHHGSSDNTTPSLRDYRPASYLISTNGHRHDHPDSESLARLIVGAEVAPTFFFNFPSTRVLSWADAASELGGFTVKHPTSGNAGLTFQLPADRPARTLP